MDQSPWVKANNLMNRALDARGPGPLTLGSEVKGP